MVFTVTFFIHFGKNDYLWHRLSLKQTFYFLFHSAIGSPTATPKGGMTRSKTTLGDCSRFGAVPQTNIGCLKKEIRYEPSMCQPMRVTKGWYSYYCYCHYCKGFVNDPYFII